MDIRRILEQSRQDNLIQTALEIAIGQNDILLRVARAAEDAWPFMFEDIPKALNSKRSNYEKLYDALKEVEHLLDE